MIKYISKDEFNASSGWHLLKFISNYNGLMFNLYHYNINGTIYSADSSEAQAAFEKEMVWRKLQKKRTYLEILKDFAIVAAEIDADKDRKLKQAWAESNRIHNGH